MFVKFKKKIICRVRLNREREKCKSRIIIFSDENQIFFSIDYNSHFFDEKNKLILFINELSKSIIIILMIGEKNEYLNE